MTQKINKVNNRSVEVELPNELKTETTTYINATVAPIIDPKETYLEMVNIMMNVINAIIHKSGFTRKYTPKLVKTPFPPLNL